MQLQDNWWVHDALATDDYMMHWQPAVIQAQSPALNHILQMHFWALGDELHQDSQLPASQTIIAVLCASAWHESRMHWLPPVIGTQSVALNQELDAVQRSGRCVSPACISWSCPFGYVDLEFVLGQNMLWCCHQLGLCMSYSGVNIKLSACGEHIQQLWILTTLSLNLSLQWNFLFLQRL